MAEKKQQQQEPDLRLEQVHEHCRRGNMAALQETLSSVADKKAAGALLTVVWNYAVSSTLVWRAR